ncbi:hypothetical protein O7614_10430 [Micromonospora sp. WMMD961]|uniref:hypothetical protein n=1 Tax=Micromonospora sp. WMMD961 TaxID=3016100 RepID=UPI002416AC80|nr:hypothetical protein [Micromonospora sp. WMMD961]MDG4780056.1 hypothetical protein [Micromonospora sp. WMMD961]
MRLGDHQPSRVLLNATVALAAAAQQRDPYLINLVFAAVPGREIYRRAGLRVATPAELEQPIEDRSLRLLTDEERRDVAYHRPGRLGDLLFNWFD